ncbi:alpha-glucosidase [Longibacter salinarum]|uniref:Alpha-glucosidase n=1 Tax=Longibacter salinarum TaxID=1850348 RepID=A0A2A8CUK9_9BACT|nr:glycoside hydrolase family 97 protein [Longibacter salinarum]PEN12229.1 alpha-glucosidase [Longibacter salinarum]
MRSFLVSFLLLTLTHLPVSAQPVSVTSPDGSLTVHLSENDGRISYRATRSGKPVIESSRLGLELHDNISLAEDLTLTDMRTASVDTTWEQVWGQERYVRNRYNELRATYETTGDATRTLVVIVRAFDDGLAFRYEIPEQPHLGSFQILNEVTEFSLREDPTAWWIEAYEPRRYEYLYEESDLSEAADTLHTPLTMKTGNGRFLSIHEAALTNYSSMTLARNGDKMLEADLVPWSDGTKVKTSAPMTSPWRTVQVTDTAGELLTSRMILNLNEPNRLENTGWIDPGKYVGVWWEMHLGTSTWGSGPKHGATTENVKRYIDFAAEHGFDGVLVEGWNEGWDGDWTKNGDAFEFTTSYPDFEMDELADYALEKGTRLIGHHETAGGVMNYEDQLPEAFDYYQEHGVRAVKTGYVTPGRSIKRMTDDGDIALEWHHGQYMVNHYRHVVKTAAEHELMINAHEPIKPTGIRRTFPNMLTREGARGQEFNAPWADGNGPAHTVTLPFTRLLAGPMDFTPGIFQLVDAGDEPEHSVPTTIAKQLALYVTLYSPLHMAADLPRNYEERPEAFQFIVDVPTNWAETRVLHAVIGDYLTVVRRAWNGDDWYLGSTTDEEERTLKAPLTFLESGVPYVAEVYRDAEDAHWKTNPLAFDHTKVLVDDATTLTLRLAPSGGTAIRFRPVSNEDVGVGIGDCRGDVVCDADFVPVSK